jgi:transposase
LGRRAKSKNKYQCKKKYLSGATAENFDQFIAVIVKKERKLILTLVTEVGLEDITTKCPSKKHFVSWLALCPNKKVSGGKVLSSKVGKGNKNLRGAFISASVGAAKVKGSYLQSFYYRIKSSADGKVAKMATEKK